MNTLPICKGATASFVSYGNVHKSLIDHILIPDVKLDLVLSCVVTNDHVLNVSRHRPVSCTLSLADMNFQTLTCSIESHIKWKNLDEVTLQLYSTKLDTALCNTDCSHVADIHLKDLHAVMRQRRRDWILAGKPRGDNDESYRQYKHAKRQFRNQHRKCAEKLFE